jgi:guanine deaminase
VVHCPSSNLFLASGAMPLARYLAAGVRVGLGSDVAAGPDVSLFDVMRAGAYTQNALRAAGLTDAAVLTPAEWLRMGSLGGAEALGLADRIGSLEVGKEADFIVVDPDVTLPIAGLGAQHAAGPDEMLSRLIFRQHPAMVRGAWVRGVRLPA